MRIKPKYLWLAFLAILGTLSFFGIFILPKDWRSAVALLTSVEQWIFNHAAFPSLFSVVLILIIGTSIIPGALKLVTTLIGKKSPTPDMKINYAIDYVVNDSASKLKQPRPPEIAEFGQAKGQRLNETGVEHNDALRLINEKLANGELHAWGRLEFIANRSKQFIAERRPIPTDYWELMALDPVPCFSDTEQMAQTIRSPGPIGRDNYAALMLCRDEVIRSFPKKNILRGAWAIIRRKPRITYWRPYH